MGCWFSRRSALCPFFVLRMQSKMSQAESGDVVVPPSLVDGYHFRKGVPPVDAVAVRLWQEAAEQGDRIAGAPWSRSSTRSRGGEDLHSSRALVPCSSHQGMQYVNERAYKKILFRELDGFANLQSRVTRRANSGSALPTTLASVSQKMMFRPPCCTAKPPIKASRRLSTI